MRRNLIVVRAGDNSLHPEWLGNGGERNWDLIVNYFGDKPEVFRHEDTRRIDSKGPKWLALHDLVSTLQEEIEQYDYVCFPDDDLACDLATLNEFFDTCREFSLELAQPALSPDSCISHPITVRNHSFRLRFTNFVEIMAPCFSRAFLKRCWPSFATNLSGHGLDFLWPTWISEPLKIAIVDSTVIRHTRFVSGAHYDLLKEKNLSTNDEVRQLLTRERIHPRLMIVGGIGTDGRLHTIWNGGYKKLIKYILTGYIPDMVHDPGAVLRLIAPIIDSATSAAFAAGLSTSTKLPPKTSSEQQMTTSAALSIEPRNACGHTSHI